MNTPIRRVPSTSFLVDLLTLVLAVAVWGLLVSPIRV
jgi:hypothetical protein